MVVINALVYRSRKDKCHVAEGYEISHLETGDTREEAMKDYLKALKSVKNLIIKEEEKGKKIELLTPETCSPRCKRSLQKIILSKKEIKPEVIKFSDNLEVHFYKEII
jgi:hypothetical protein